jgi:type II secretory pathway component GspD/PulD (secretin)
MLELLFALLVFVASLAWAAAGWEEHFAEFGALIRQARERARDLGKPPRPVAFALMRVSALRMAERLKAHLGDNLKVTADEGINTLFVWASPGKLRECQKIIDRVDVRVSSNRTYIVPVRPIDPETAARKLQALLTKGEFLTFHIIPDARTNSLILSPASDRLLTEVKGILRRLDVKDQAQDKRD